MSAQDSTHRGGSSAPYKRFASPREIVETKLSDKEDVTKVDVAPSGFKVGLFHGYSSESQRGRPNLQGVRTFSHGSVLSGGKRYPSSGIPLSEARPATLIHLWSSR